MWIHKAASQIKEDAMMLFPLASAPNPFPILTPPSTPAGGHRHAQHDPDYHPHVHPDVSPESSGSSRSARRVIPD